VTIVFRCPPAYGAAIARTPDWLGAINRAPVDPESSSRPPVWCLADPPPRTRVEGGEEVRAKGETVTGSFDLAQPIRVDELPYHQGFHLTQ